MIPTTREQFKDWCLRQLGHPVININVDDDQVDDCVDMALEYWHDFHFDGVERVYLKHELTQENKDNGYIPVANTVIGVTRIWPVTNSTQSSGMFNFQYQLRLNDLWNLTSAQFTNYTIAMSHLRMMDMIFNGEQPIRYNRHTDKVYLDIDWDKLSVGEWLIVEARVVTKPETYAKAHSLYQACLGCQYEEIRWSPTTWWCYTQWQRNIRRGRGRNQRTRIED